MQDPRERPAEQQQAADEAHKKFGLTNALISFLMSSSGIGLRLRVLPKKATASTTQELKRRFLSPRRLREWREVMGQLKALVDDLDWRLEYGTRYI